jgi:hypothetical protein
MEGPVSMQISLDFDQNCRNRGVRILIFGVSPADISPLGHRNLPRGSAFTSDKQPHGGWQVGRGLLLWLIGIPLPIILVIWLFGGLS